MRISVRLTEKKLRTLDKTTACGVVRGLYVQVSKLKDGTLAKYFILRDRLYHHLYHKTRARHTL